MRIVFDTGVFFRPEALRGARGTVVVPAVAYAERLRQVEAQGHAQADAFRAAAAPLVEAFGVEQAERVMPLVASMPAAEWKRLARDALIAGHVGPGDELWTTDPEDFLAVGVPKEQIVAV